MKESQRIDPRTVITPDAFNVEADLLGRPLASPARRGVALLLDLALASILAELGGVLIGLAVAVVFFRVATRRVLDHPLKRWARASFALMGAFVFFITAVAVVESDEDDEDRNRETVAATDGASVDWSSMGQGDYRRLARTMAAAQTTDSAGLGDAMGILEDVLGAALGGGAAVPDSLGPEERAEAVAVLQTYAAALADNDRAVLDSLQDRAVTLVAAKPIERLRAQVQVQDKRIDALEAANERLAEVAANPGIKRIGQALADDFGLTIGWIGLYFTLFLAWWHGQTPAKRLFGLQVVRLNGQPITLRVAFERFGGYAAGVVTGLLGFFQIFWDDNRQGIHDRIAGTTVIRKPKS